MKKYQSSLTAEGIAIVRAIESDKPADVRICYDPYAKYLVNPFLAAILRLFTRLGYADKRGPGVWEFLTARERYIDDYLAACIEVGLDQLVILGAGFDSRAYRFEALSRIKVFEVDHPATQKAKLDKLNRALKELPDYVVHVPIDFETETLEDRLFHYGYDPKLKTLFIWQGVIHYLTPEAADKTLAFITQNSGPGSSLIFDYVYASAVRGAERRGEIAAMRRNRRLSGEEIKFGIPEGEVIRFLQLRGFHCINNATASDLHGLYFKGVNANKILAPVYAIATAKVGPSARTSDLQ